MERRHDYWIDFIAARGLWRLSRQESGPWAGHSVHNGVRYSTSCLASSGNRLARRPQANTTGERREAAAPFFLDAGGLLLSDFH